MKDEIWLIKAFIKTYSYSSLQKLLDDWWPVIGVFNSNWLEDFNFALNETYECPCDYGGYVRIARMEDVPRQ